MKSRLRFRRELLLLAIPVALMVALAIHFQRFTAVSGRLVGSWECNDSPAGAFLTTFKANGEWEAVCFDGPSHVASTVFKGRYADSGNTFRTYDIKRYLRKGSVDIWVEPCDKGNEAACSENHEATDADKELSKPKHIYTIISPNWEAGIIKVKSPDYGQYEGSITTWKRQ